MNKGKYRRLSPDELTANHNKIIELKEQGLSLNKIAAELNTTYGSVLYVIYRKNNNGLWKKAS